MNSTKQFEFSSAFQNSLWVFDGHTLVQFNTIYQCTLKHSATKSVESRCQYFPTWKILTFMYYFCRCHFLYIFHLATDKYANKGTLAFFHIWIACHLLYKQHHSTSSYVLQIILSSLHCHLNYLVQSYTSHCNLIHCRLLTTSMYLQLCRLELPTRRLWHILFVKLIEQIWIKTVSNFVLIMLNLQ